MAEKLFYSMGEVAEMFDVNASLIRHWETQFSVLRPKRNKKGNRLFTPQDVENLKLIYHLVKEQGMTLEGARKALRQRRCEPGVQRDMELLERLQRVRAMLEEVREELKDSSSSVAVELAEAGDGIAQAGAPQQRPRRAKAVVKLSETEGAAEEAPTEAGKKPRAPRRKREKGEAKELFAFYEQSLF